MYNFLQYVYLLFDLNFWSRGENFCLDTLLAKFNILTICMYLAKNNEERSLFNSFRVSDCLGEQNN